MTAVNKYEDDGEVNHMRCKILFFFPSPLNLVNLEAVIANLICELCDTVSNGKVLCCLSVCRFGVQEDHMSGQTLRHPLCEHLLSYEDQTTAFN